MLKFLQSNKSGQSEEIFHHHALQQNKQSFSISKEHTLKMGSRMSWQKVLGSFFPSGPVADLLNLPVAGSKYLQKKRAKQISTSSSGVKAWQLLFP